jgi:site-specific recombinase XerD
MTTNNGSSEKNKLQGGYLSANLNEVWTIDVTTVNRKYYWFFIMDLASRRVIWYDVSEYDYTATQAALILQKAISLEESIYPKKTVRIVHTDSRGMFLSNDWQQCLIENNIGASSSDSKNNQNQVSERFNLTFKKLLRGKLNKDLKKVGNKTSTLHLLREATKYNFQNLINITDELIEYYNTKKPHDHLKGLTPDAWAYEARLLPSKTHILKRKEEECILSGSDPVVEVLEKKEDVLEHIELLSLYSKELGLGLDIRDEKPEEILEKMLYLNKSFSIVPAGVTKNNNSDTARKIREHKSNIGFLHVRSHVEEKKIDLSLMSPEIQTLYGEMLSDNNKWKDVELESLKTILLQNELLLSNVEDLKKELREKTELLQSQNQELLDRNQELLDKNDEILGMNRFLVDKAKEAEEEKRVIWANKLKRKNAKKQVKRDYISPDEFYEIVDKLVYKYEDSRYISARQRLLFFIMYFTGLRVINLLVLTRRHLHELMNNSYTEIPLIKGGRPNQIVGIGEDAQDLLTNHFIEDICILLKDKEDDEFVFTSETNRFNALHRVSLTRDLNKILKYASEHFHKKITCHSFRVTFITEGLEKGIPMHIMRKAIGHQSIKSTEHYVRHDLSPSEWINTVKLTNRDRIKSFNIKIEENIARKARKDSKKIDILSSNKDLTVFKKKDIILNVL